MISAWSVALIWQLFTEYFDEFEERYDEFFSNKYGFYRPVISPVVRKFLDRLGLYEEDKPNRDRAPPVSQDVVERIIESYDGGWPDYEEAFIDVKTL